MKRKGIKTTEISRGYYRHSGFKSDAQNFAKDLRIENMRDYVDGVAVRVEKRKEGWVVNEFDL